MTKEVNPSKILSVVFLFFLLVYPNLFVFTVNLLASYSFPRLILLLFTAIFSILVIKNVTDAKLLWIFVIPNLLFSLLQVFNPNEDELVYTILGVDSRVEGTIYQVLLLLFMVGAYFNLKNNSYKTYFNFICLSLLFQAIVIFQQYLENPLEVFGIPLSFITYGEVSGIVGRAAFAASLMLPGVFIGFVGTSDKSIIIKTMSYLTIFFTTLAISLTENRSSILAATVGLTVFLFFNIKNIKRVVQIVGCIVIANFGTNLFPNELKENRSFTNSQTLETRLEMWKIALKLLPSSWGFPIWGGGTGEFKLTIAKHLPARDLLTVLQKEYAWQPNENISKIELISPQNAPIRQKTYKVTYKDGTSKFAFQVIDRAHNFFLDRIYSIGLLGAVLWIIFYTYPIFAYFRLRPEQKTTEIQVLVASLVAIQVYHIFWFSVMQVEPIHVVIALMAWVRIQKPQPNLSAATMT